MARVFFGGAFDPVTSAHMRIIRRLLDEHGADALVIGVTDHDYKSRPRYSLADRILMLQLALNSELPQDLCSRITVLVQDRRTYAFLGRLPGELRPSAICIGSDELWQLAEGKWENARGLTSDYDLIVMHRNDLVSSTRAREKLELLLEARKHAGDPGMDEIIAPLSREVAQLLPGAVLDFLC